MELLNFLYCKPCGEEKEVSVIHWKESGRYIVGQCAASRMPRTYRKDRVVRYHNGAEQLLQDPFPPPPPSLERAAGQSSERLRGDKSSGPEILFTGFPSVQRADLEQKAMNAGMHVVSSVTRGLSYICGGPNAGPTKLEKAREKGVWILNQPLFIRLLETGELPDDEPEFV